MIMYILFFSYTAIYVFLTHVISLFARLVLIENFITRRNEIFNISKIYMFKYEIEICMRT